MRIPLLLGLLLLSAAGATAPTVTRIEAAQSAAWVQWLSPLPKQVTLAGKMTVPLDWLRVQLPGDPTELDRTLVTEFATALGEKAGAQFDPQGRVAGDMVLLDFRRRPEDSRVLGSKRNPEQAYALTMTADAGKLTLTCQALSDQGSYFGMKTLKQLLVPTIRGQGSAATVDVPTGRIVDWPDLQERGQWGGSALQDFAWLTDLKYNLLEVHATVTVDTQGVGHARMAPEVLQACKQHGVRVVPIIHHLEQLGNVGLFEAYPMVVAKDADTGNPQQKVICFAQPEIVKPLTNWLVDLGNTPGVTEVMIWLSEEGKGCQCDQCKHAVRFVQELEACVKALRAAQQVVPSLGLRVLLTQGSYPQNDKVLAALPSDVKVSYYDGGRTYNTERKPMIYPVLEPYLRQGRWMGVYPTLSSNWLTVAPFSNPQFAHYRLAEFVDKGLQNIVAFIVPTALYYRVNTEGGLEWAWNAHGRTPREFAVSYAVRHGLKNPEQFAQWTELIGPPAWDVYASNFPFYEHWGRPTLDVASGKTKVSLGGPYFVEYKTEAQFGANLQRCDEAMKLAEALGEPQFVAETKIVRGYTEALQAIYKLNKLLDGQEIPDPQKREAARPWFLAADAGLQTVIASYPQWSLACQAGQHEAPERFGDTVTMMEQLAAKLGELMEQQGLVDTSKPYRLHVIGTWKTEDFTQMQRQTRRMDVTELVDGPGTYVFRPAYRSGSLGLTASQVKLVSFARDRPEETRDEAVDNHTCHAGAWAEDDVYTLTLAAYDAERGHAVLADIGGGNSTVGDFLFRKMRQ